MCSALYAAATASSGSRPAPLGRAGDLHLVRDVFALAEERLVEPSLERTQLPELRRPDAGRERERRARLVARQVDLDARGERPRIHAGGPVDPQMVAPRLQQRARRRAQLERQPRDLDRARVLCPLDRVRLEIRVRADDVVVEGNLCHEHARATRLGLDDLDDGQLADLTGRRFRRGTLRAAIRAHVTAVGTHPHGPLPAARAIPVLPHLLSER